MATAHNPAPHSAARSPLVFDVSRLGRRPGAMQTITQSVGSPARIGLDLIAIEPGAPLDLDLRLESVSEGAGLRDRARPDPGSARAVWNRSAGRSRSP